MKRFLFLSLCLIGSVFQAQAQAASYKMFEWEVLNAGYAVGKLNGTSAGGLIFASELRFNATDNIAVGFKTSAALLVNTGSNTTVGVSGGYFLTGDYNLVDGYKKFRPYGGLQLGYVSGATANAGTVGVSTSGLAVGPRAGFEYGHARVTAQYAYSFSEFAPSYFGVSLGLVLWGGEKK
jgi:hypothetical protein